MKIIVTRHGETEANRRGAIQGAGSNGTLTDLGKRQADKLANRLKNEKIDLIVSSDLKRALETAKIVAKFHKKIEIVAEKGLRERDFGSFEGKTREELGVPNGVLLIDHFKDGDIEGNSEIFERAKKLVEDILERDIKNVLLVGHGGICKFVIDAFIGEGDCKVDNLGLGNTSVSVLERKGKGFEIKLLNCMGHLE